MNASRIVSILENAGYSPVQVANFLEFHRGNRKIWGRFEARVFARIGGGAKRVGAKDIAERLRWDDQGQRVSDYKINNNFISMYARVFAAKHSRLAHYFTFKKTGGANERRSGN